MREFEYDPFTGISRMIDWEETATGARAIVTTSQDVSPLLDRNKAIANDGAADAGIKAGMWLYGSIPTLVVMELKKKGVDVFNPDHTKRVFQEINANYPYCKTTYKTHS